jgi:hypothetical protein
MQTIPIASSVDPDQALSGAVGRFFFGVWDRRRRSAGGLVDEAQHAHAVDDDDRSAEPAAEGE